MPPGEAGRVRVDGNQTTGSVIALADDGAVHRVVVSIPGSARRVPIGPSAPAETAGVRV